MKNIDWYKIRKTYIGGSEISAIAGVNPYKTAVDVYLDKISDDVDTSTPSEAAHFGNLLENVIAEEYGKRTKNRISIEPNLIRHSEYPFVACNIDRWVNDKEFILECKTTSLFNKDDWGAEGTDSMPDYYLLQCAYYSMICNVSKVDVAVLIGGQNFKIMTYYKNPELETQLITIAKNFWLNNVMKKIPPVATSLQDVSKLYPISEDNSVTIDDEIKLEIENLQYAKQKLAEYENLVKESQIKIQNYMQDNSFLLDNDGSVLVTWKSTKPRKSFDSKTFEQENPDLYSKYIKEGKAYRTFLIKTKGDKGNE